MDHAERFNSITHAVGTVLAARGGVLRKMDHCAIYLLIADT
ncbi:hypothetical protein [Massilia sp.]